MAEEAERYGYINRTLPVDELDEFVTDLARRITSFPRSAIQATKQAVVYGDNTLEKGLLEEQHLFNQTRSSDEAQTRMAKFMMLGAQTRKGELDLDSIIDKL